jgi:hypothetical protein
MVEGPKVLLKVKRLQKLLGQEFLGIQSLPQSGTQASTNIDSKSVPCILHHMKSNNALMFG